MGRQRAIMTPSLAEQHVRALVARYADALRVRAPAVRFVKASAGPCYEALLNRIELDERTLSLPGTVLDIVIAHEVAHATQRRAMLLDLAWTGLGAVALLAVPCTLFAASSVHDVWRVCVPGAAFAVTWFACARVGRSRAMKRAAEFELDADAKAAQLCGAACTLQALEVMAQRVHIEAARIDAMRARLPAS